jgi:hypothetical protein
MTGLWKENWADTQRRFADWWNGKGFIVGSWGGVRRATPHAAVPDPGPAASLEQQWTDLDWRAAAIRHQAAHTAWPLETLPVADPWLGPGSLALYLGAQARLMPNTIWYDPAPLDPDRSPPIAFDAANPWWKLQLALMDRLIAESGGNYFVGSPDLVENWDVLASLRGEQALMMDMIERPEWVHARLSEVHRAWREAFDRVHARIRAQDGRSMFGWFRLWAPGRVAKVQCDGCAMFSPAMFREFVVPTLTEQCAGLDRSLYHLDGSQCLCHLDALLEIEPLTAIEWTPDPKVPSGGDPHWYGLYRRILAAGKRVQVLGASAAQIEPLLDAVGGDGVYFLSWFGTEAQAEEFERVAAGLRGK